MKKLLLFLLLVGACAAQTIPAVPGVYSLTGSSGSSGSGTVSSGTTNHLSKYTAATTVGDSLAADDGTTLTYTGSGGISVNTGSTAGAISLTQGTTQSTGTTNITIQAPTSVTSYIRTLPAAAGSTGFLLETVAGSVQTESLVAGTGSGSVVRATAPTLSLPVTDNVVFTQSALSAGTGTVDIDFNGNGQRTVTLTGNITFTTSNKAAGKSVTVFITGDSSLRTFTFPAWKFQGAAAPASLAANKTAALTLTCTSTTDASIWAAYAAEP